ncbi:archease [Methanococcoides seepicolus]|uniref:Archease n=1 Tax=Methanococcoides seepicolus TaxID=2828780 RepID=A0A9E4ZFB0_9EURY|nr:archease [Methanococcoides seepicolus]
MPKASNHIFDLEIRAVTYNELKIEDDSNGWVMQVVVDI